MATLDLGQGLSLHYYDLNSGGAPIVILLHGLGATGDSWQLQLPALLESGYRILAPDMRGFGKSSYPEGPNSPRIMAEDVANFLNRLEVTSVYVVGISMGGTIALQFALEHPSMVDSLLLVNTFARLRPRKISYWLFYSIRFLLIQVLGIPYQARFVAKRLFPYPEQELLRETFYNQIIQANPAGYRSTIKSFVNFNVTDRLCEIQSPTLVVTGDEDTVVPPKTQKELADKIPNADQVVINNTGHAVIVEKPEEFNHVMLGFLHKDQ
jgi:3-oxoadipate enol-lactonase